VNKDVEGDKRQTVPQGFRIGQKQPLKESLKYLSFDELRHDRKAF